MKFKQFFLILLMLGLTSTLHAQFLNQLKKRVIERSSEAIISTTADKVADKAAEKTAKMIDGVFDATSLEGIVGPLGKMKDVSTLPSSYQFNQLYSLEMKMEGNSVQMDYYLNTNEPYFGASMDLEGASDVFLIFDEPNKSMITVFGGNTMAMDMPTADINDDELDDLSDYTISKLPNKTFLGYDCEGRLVENKESKIIVYFAPKLDNAFAHIQKLNNKKMPSGVNKYSSQMGDGLMMYMEITDKTSKKEKDKNDGIIQCIAYENTSKNVKIR